jgi:fatty acid desaturase
VAFHLGVLATLAAAGGWSLALRVHAVPVFLAFPVWFALNRVGQHYDIDPADPSRWTTRLRRSPFWEFVFLWSNHHHEHHAFPRVPFYHLVDLHRLLRASDGDGRREDRRYRDLLWGWLVRNQPPHARWSAP